MTTLLRVLRSCERNLGRRLLELAGIDRIHVIGCARSGTTMLQHAMIAFDNTLIAEGETGPRYPFLKDRFKLFLHHVTKQGVHHLVTKRNFRWFLEAKLQELIDWFSHENVGILHIVRDPRDVLTSIHKGTGRNAFYVPPDRWMASILAAERIFAAFADYHKKLTIRYEDLVLQPDIVAQSLCDTFGLRIRDDVVSFSRLEDNWRSSKIGISARSAVAMQGIRNFDPNSVGRWRSLDFDARRRIDDLDIAAKFDEVILRYGYS